MYAWCFQRASNECTGQLEHSNRKQSIYVYFMIYAFLPNKFVLGILPQCEGELVCNVYWSLLLKINEIKYD